MAKKIYILQSLSSAEEYIRLKGDASKIKPYVVLSEFQYLDKSPVKMEISEDGGLEFPDLIYHEGIMFASDMFKRFLDSQKIDYLFWKQADIVSEKFGKHEKYWIMVPPRIDCLDVERSSFEKNWDWDNGLLPQLEATKIVVDPARVGNFQIFKILGINDNNIYVTKELCEQLEARNFEGVEFYKLKGGELCR